MLAAHRLAGALALLGAQVAAAQRLHHPELELLAQIALDARHQVPFETLHQRDRRALAVTAPGSADAVQIVVAAARHIEVDHQLQAVHIQPPGRHVGGHQHRHRAAVQPFQRQLAVLGVLVAVQHEHLVGGGTQHSAEAVGGGLGVGEHDRLAVGLMGEQPLHQALLVGAVVGGDDLLAHLLVELAHAVEHQRLGLAQHPRHHGVHGRAARRGGEQQRLPGRVAGRRQTQHVVAEAHVEHAVRFVQHQHLEFGQRQIVRFQMLDQPARRAHQHLRVLADARRLHLEVLAAGDRFRLDKGEARQRLHLLERLPGQLPGGRQHQRPGADAPVLLFQQTLQHGQHEGGGLAGAGPRHHAQVPTRQSGGNSRRLHRRGLTQRQLFQGAQ